MLELFNPETRREDGEELQEPSGMGWALADLLLTSIKSKTQRDGFCLQVRILERAVWQ